MKYLVYSVLFFLIALSSSSQPQINSFTPATAPAGATVNISGANFSATPSGNTVYFGAVKAAVVSASANALSVQVPTGATYSPITVTVNGLTGLSRNYFSVSYPGGGYISQFSFSNPVQFTTDLHPNGIIVADFDGDGKADLATPNNYVTAGQPASVSVLRNISTTSGLAMAPKLDLVNGAETYAAASADIDGDGKPDIIACSIVDQNISVFRNTSTAGTISFAPKVNFGSGSSPQSIAAADIDSDGKPDIVVVNTTANSISVFRNTTTGSTISFAAKVDFSTQLFPKAVVAADFDGDGKTDIAVTNNASYSFSIFKNMSTAGNITLNSPQNFLIATGQKPAGLVVFDFNADNKPDLGIEVNEIDFVSKSVCQVYRNASTAGSLNFSYANSVSASSFSAGYYLSAGDINGDGKVDLALPVTNSGFSSAFENTTGSGSAFAFFLSASGPYYSASPYGTALADLDGDNRPELITNNFTGTNLSVFFNRCGLPTVRGFDPTFGTAGSLISISGENFTGTAAVSFGGIPASSFTVVSPTEITAVVANGASGAVAVTNGTGTDSKTGFVYNGPPSITTFSPVNAGAGQTITINGSFSGTVTGVSFGGVAAASFTVVSPNQITAVAGPGATGNVTVTTNLGTASAPGFTFFLPPSITTFSPSAGFTGTTVTITGTNFSGATAVKIGGVPVLSFSVISQTGIQAIVGHGASGSIAVTTPGGTASKDTFNFIPPSIASISPLSGSAGDTITINGSNFSNITTNNAVYFGAVKAMVVSAANSVLKVVVPAGTTYQKIAVITNGATAYSHEHFRFIFAGVDSLQPLFPASYRWQSRFAAGDDPYYIKCADLDGDGKADQVIASYNTDGKVMILRNTSTNGIISFAPALDITQSYYNARWFIADADLNADGKNDIVIASSTVLWVFINTSTPGNISFASYLNLATTDTYIRELVTDDFDGDGKTDIAVRGYASGGNGPDNVHILSIYRNTGINGNVSFSRYDKTLNGTVDLDYINGQYFTSYMLAGDFDNDNKTDFIVRSADFNSLSVIRNLSTPGNIVFAAPVSVSITESDVLAVADLDNDGKQDLVGRSRADTKTLAFLKNTTTAPGNFSFILQSSIATQKDLFFVSTGELTGDGRVDAVTRGDATASLSVYRNVSMPGAVLFDTANTFTDPVAPVYAFINDVFVADMDGDGKSDINAVDREHLSVFKNRINDFTKIQLCAPAANTSITSGLTGPLFQWKVNTGSGFININDNANYSGTNTSTLLLNNIPSAWYGYQYTCVSNNVYSNVFSLQFTNTFNSIVSNFWENPLNWSCGVLPDSNTDVFINSGSLILNSTTTIRSLKLGAGASLTINPGVSLTILH
jgi:hypothetical protein